MAGEAFGGSPAMMLTAVYCIQPLADDLMSRLQAFKDCQDPAHPCSMDPILEWVDRESFDRKMNSLFKYGFYYADFHLDEEFRDTVYMGTLWIRQACERVLRKDWPNALGLCARGGPDLAIASQIQQRAHILKETRYSSGIHFPSFFWEGLLITKPEHGEKG